MLAVLPVRSQLHTHLPYHLRSMARPTTVLLSCLAHALVLALQHLRVVPVLAAVPVLLADLGSVLLVVAVHLPPPLPCHWRWVALLLVVDLGAARLCMGVVLPCCRPTQCLLLHLVPPLPLSVSRHLTGVQVALLPSLLLLLGLACYMAHLVPTAVCCLAAWRRTCAI